METLDDNAQNRPETQFDRHLLVFDFYRITRGVGRSKNADCLNMLKRERSWELAMLKAKHTRMRNEPGFINLYQRGTLAYFSPL